MNHLTETQLNEYMDHTLSTLEQRFIEKHMSTCLDCQNKMEALRSLFQTLSDVPEESLNRDLTPLVLYRLPEKKIGLGWKLVLAVQAGVALGLTILVFTNLLPLVNMPNILLAFTLKLAPIELPAFRCPLPTLNFQTSTSNLIFLAASALILWGMGNAVILRSRREARK